MPGFKQQASSVADEVVEGVSDTRAAGDIVEPRAGSRTTHHDKPEIKPGIVSEQRVPGTEHHVRITADGRVVRCSTCGELKNVYADELASNSGLSRRLDDIEKITDPAEKNRQATQLAQDLARARGNSFIGQDFSNLRNDPRFREAYNVSTTREGTSVIRRQSIENGYPQLRVGSDGRVIEATSINNRISQPGKLARNLGGSKPNHQAHHLIPDAVVRDHPLAQAARTRGNPPYNLDSASNGIHLPNGSEARIGDSANLPIHNGSHPEWNKRASERLNDLESDLIEDYGNLDNVPPDVLAQAVRNVENDLREEILELDTLN